MAETGMSDWILLNASNALQGVSAFIFAPASWLLYVVLSFLIPSSSGMATVSMPIMGPFGCEPRFLGRDHGHDLQLRKWLREPVHSYLRRDYGWLGSCSCAVWHVA